MIHWESWKIGVRTQPGTNGGEEVRATTKIDPENDLRDCLTRVSSCNKGYTLGLVCLSSKGKEQMIR